jgi:two-component system, NtrC family, response regulator HupR/HoxA
MSSGATVLVVDDEIRSQEAIQRVLSEEFDVLCAGSAAEAETVLAGEMVQVVLCDQRMPGESGTAFLTRVRANWPDPVRLVISGYTDSEDIIAGVNEAGIYQYITKPWHPDRLLSSVREAVKLYRLQKETGSPVVETKVSSENLTQAIASRRRSQRRQFEFTRIAHAPDSPMQDVIALARRASEYDISVCITGASGTGKELLARAIHFGSMRSEMPFVVENCGALPDELLESELFGCKKGAFTGAYQDRTGLFELADGGSIFLDEIGETSPAFQVKLLRVLQEGEIRPLGAGRPRKIDVRVICATNRNLDDEVAAGRFRRDLYYRLAAFPIHLPALAERPMDIPILADRILADVNRSFRRKIDSIAPDAMRKMMVYAWPGNVRELQNEIQRMVVLANSDAPLSADCLSERLAGVAPRKTNGSGNGRDAASLKDRVESLERGIIEESLRLHAGNISRVAEHLGLSRVGLRAKIDRYEIRRGVVDDE